MTDWNTLDAYHNKQLYLQYFIFTSDGYAWAGTWQMSNTIFIIRELYIYPSQILHLCFNC